MELLAWPRLLARAALQEHESALVKVWVRLFRVMNSLLFSRTSVQLVGQPVGECDEASDGGAEQQAPTEEDEESHLQEVVTTLEQLMLGADVGAFEAYLRILRSFERQMAAEEFLDRADSQTPSEVAFESKRKRSYRTILHNIGAYYRQFSAPLQKAVATRLAPVETKLKEFVKLSSWSDRNYVALKQSVERSHAQLNRCVNQYQEILRQTAAGLLAANGSAVVSDEAAEKEEPDASELVSAERQAATTLLMLGTISQSSPSAEGAPEGIPLFLTSSLTTASDLGQANKLQSARLPMLCVKMRKLCAEDILGTVAAKRSADRQEFLHSLRSTIFSRAADLRLLTTKKARQQKHKAVVDLLKELQAVGFSFHASAADPRQLNSSGIFRVEAAELDFTSAFATNALPSCGLSACWQASWDRTEQLYFRCWLNLTLLRHTRPSAHQDLSAREVNKAAGFVEHSFALLLRQRETIQGALTSCAALQQHLGQLEGVSLSGVGAAGGERNNSEVVATGRARTLPSQKGLSDRLRFAQGALNQLLHVAVETSVLFDQMSAMPQKESLALGAATLALHRLCSRLQGARRQLPDIQSHPREETLGPSSLFLTAEHETALEWSDEEVAAMSMELRGSVNRLSVDDARFLAPLLQQFDSYLAASSELRSVEPEAKEEIGDCPSAGPFVEAVEQAVVQVLLAIQGLRQYSVQQRSFGGEVGGKVAAQGKDQTPSRPAEENVVGEHNFIKSLLEAARCERLDSSLREVERTLHQLAAGDSSQAQRAMLSAAQAHICQLCPALAAHLASFQWALHQAIGYHGAHVRLQLVRIPPPSSSCCTPAPASLSPPRLPSNHSLGAIRPDAYCNLPQHIRRRLLHCVCKRRLGRGQGWRRRQC